MAFCPDSIVLCNKNLSPVPKCRPLQHSLLTTPKYNDSSLTVPCLTDTGISVRKGKGRYRDTHIVTFAPRYMLDNRSTHKLAFAQREFARGKVKETLDNTYFIFYLFCTGVLE